MWFISEKQGRHLGYFCSGWALSSAALRPYGGFYSKFETHTFYSERMQQIPTNCRRRVILSYVLLLTINTSINRAGVSSRKHTDSLMCIRTFSFAIYTQ